MVTVVYFTQSTAADWGSIGNKKIYMRDDSEGARVSIVRWQVAIPWQFEGVGVSKIYSLSRPPY